MKVLGVVLIVLGLLALAAGVVYFTVAADKLPHFMGQIAHATGHRSKRGIAALVGGAVLVIAGSFAVRSKA